jgi:Tol biopolymer transport system component
MGGPPGPFNNADIWVMNADGSDQVNLTAEAGDAGSMESPTWSPRQADGSHRIAYSRQLLADGYMRGRIWSMRADGADKRALTVDGPQLDADPAWSPDGRSIVFIRTGGEAMGDLWIMGATGGAARQLMARDPVFDQRSPAWSPDGRFIAFTSNHELGENNRWDYQIYTVTADGSTIVRRTEGHEKLNPTWVVRP